MSYVPENWVDHITPVDAARMNHIEQGIAAVEQGAMPAPPSPNIGDALIWNGTGWVSEDVLGLVEPFDLMVNGSLGIWERGTGPFTANGFCADAWRIALGAGASISVSASAIFTDTEGPHSGRSMIATYTHGSAESRIINDFPGDWWPMRDKTVTHRFVCRTSVANAVRIGLTDGVTTVYSDYHPGDGNWRTLLASMHPAAASTKLECFFSLMASGTHYFDNGDLIVGLYPASLDWPQQFSRDSTQENSRAERKFQKIEVNASFKAVAGGDSATFPIYLRSAPYTQNLAVAVFTAGTRTNIGVPTYAISRYGGKVTLVATAAGQATLAGEIVGVSSG